jgi:hypothetical protein
MRDLPDGFSSKKHSNSERDFSIVVQPLFTEDRKRHDGQGEGSGVGLLLHRSVNEVVKVGDIMSAVDAMLMDMALHGYVQPVAQSEVVKTLKEIRRTGKIARSSSVHQE